MSSATWTTARESDLSPFLWRQEAEDLTQTQKLLPLLWTLPHVFGVWLHLLWQWPSSGSLMEDFHHCSPARTKEQCWILSQFQTALQTKCSSAFYNLLALEHSCLVYFSQIRLWKLLWHCWFCLLSFLKISISSSKILLTFSFFSCSLHSEALFSMLGATADSITTFSAIHPPKSSNLFVFNSASQSWSCIWCSTPKLQTSLSAALLKLVPIILNTGVHPASSQHHLPDVLLCLSFSAASGATLWCAAGTGHLLSPGLCPRSWLSQLTPPSALQVLSHPPAYFPPCAWRTLHSCVSPLPN